MGTRHFLCLKRYIIFVYDEKPRYRRQRPVSVIGSYAGFSTFGAGSGTTGTDVGVSGTTETGSGSGTTGTTGTTETTTGLLK